MTHASFAFALPIVATLLGGCANHGPGLEEAAIVGGTRGGDPAVVWIYNADSGGLCTGTLIDRRVVLTAKHCVQEPGASGPSAPSRFYVGLGDRAGAGRTLRVQSVYATPGVWYDRGLSGLVGRDVAVMVLASGVTDPEVVPIPVRRTSPRDLVGDTFTAIGYGQIPSGSAGTKYTVQGRVTGVSADLIYVGAVTCQGDSGGPMVTEERTVAGVVSFGSGGCGSGYGAYNAVFSYLEMIDRAIEEAGGCINDEPDGETLCDGTDNDCDGYVDEPCTPIGEPCGFDAECMGQTCRDTVAGRICTQPCDARRPGFGCGEGFYCARTSPYACDGWCVPLHGEAALPVDAPCESDAQCASLYCADPGDGVRRCLASCARDAGMCLAGEVCVALGGACGGCVPADIVIGLPHGLGEPCRADADCAAGSTCFDDEGNRYCSRPCGDEASCPSGYHCRAGSCARGTLGGLGEPCVTSEDCGPGAPYCAAHGASRWCTAICDDSTPCAMGFDCVPATGASVCAPNVGLVGAACDAPDDCISGRCSDGACVRECSVDAPCGPGFECRRTEDGSSALCVRPAPPPSGGGCAVGPVRARAIPAILAAVVAATVLAMRRRRGRRAS